MDERLAAVHELWAVYRERGPEFALLLLDEDVEFVDRDGRAYHGHEGVRRFFGQFVERGQRFVASPFTFEPHGDDVMVVGHHRIASSTGLRGDYLFFVHSFRDGCVARIAAFDTREAALEDIAARATR